VDDSTTGVFLATSSEGGRQCQRAARKRKLRQIQTWTLAIEAGSADLQTCCKSLSLTKKIRRCELTLGSSASGRTIRRSRFNRSRLSLRPTEDELHFES